MHLPFIFSKRRKNTDRIVDLPLKVPRAFTLEITPKCNFNCPYCYCLWHEFPHLVDKCLSFEEWKNIITALVEHKVHNFMFSGGEALLCPFLSDLLIFTRKKSNSGKISLFTNGALVNSDFLRICSDIKINIAVSLQGLKSYQQMTGSNSDYQDILKLLKQCSNMGIPVSVSTVVTQLNKHEICDVFSAAADAGAGFIQLGPMMVQGKGRHRADLALSRDEWENVKQQIRNMKNCHTPYTFCEEMICQCRKHPDEIFQKFSLDGVLPCSAGKASGVISPDGSYRKCLHYIKSE